MTGKHSTAMARIQHLAPQSHCILHQEAIAAKHLTMMGRIQRNLTRSWWRQWKQSTTTISRLLVSQWQATGAATSSLLLHVNVRWLSRGRVLVGISHLRRQVLVFLTEKTDPRANLSPRWSLGLQVFIHGWQIHSPNWICRIKATTEASSQLLIGSTPANRSCGEKDVTKVDFKRFSWLRKAAGKAGGEPGIYHWTPQRLKDNLVCCHKEEYLVEGKWVTNPFLTLFVLDDTGPSSDLRDTLVDVSHD